MDGDGIVVIDDQPEQCWTQGEHMSTDVLAVALRALSDERLADVGVFQNKCLFIEKDCENPIVEITHWGAQTNKFEMKRRLCCLYLLRLCGKKPTERRKQRAHVGFAANERRKKDDVAINNVNSRQIQNRRGRCVQHRPIRCPFAAREEIELLTTLTSRPLYSR